MTRRISGLLAVLVYVALLTGCAPKVERKAPEGSAPPSGSAGTVQKGPQLKLSPD